MRDPYDVFGIEKAIDESEIRRCYLRLVREFSPERAPERFAEIRNAYEQLRDPVRRLQQRLFEPNEHDSLDAILVEARNSLRDERIPTKTLLSMAARS